MNGLTGTRRLARPVRLSLAQRLGGDIDGAWWPYTASIAGELPGFIQLLHHPLGEVVDICVNWSTLEAAVDLTTIASGPRTLLGARHRKPRVMSVTGRDGSVKLLVLPHLTTQALGAVVMRRAAAVLGPQDQGQLLETADSVIRLAEEESAQWSAGFERT